MKNILAVAIGLFLAGHSFCQRDSSNFEKLLSQFADACSYAVKTPNVTYFEQLNSASHWTLRIDNPVFLRVKIDFEGRLGKAGEDSIHLAVADSIYKRYVKDFFWGEQSLELFMFKDALALYNEGYCNCLTERIKNKERIRLVKHAEDCNNFVAADTLLLKKVQAALKDMPVNEKRKAGPLALKYVYQHCPAATFVFNDVLFQNILSDRYSHFSDAIWAIEKKIVRLYTRKKLDSLSMVFPAYTSCKKDIEASVNLVNSKTEYMSTKEDDKSDPDAVTKIITYYRNQKGKKSELLGQVICRYTIHNLDLQVTGYQFLPADKIKDKDRLLNEIDIEPPPPPVELLKKTPGN